MKIRLAAIPFDALGKVRPLVDVLCRAVKAGEMDDMDKATGELLALTADAPAVRLDEDEWRGFLAEVRTRTPEFRADYLISGEVCSRYFPGATSATMVLQLPVEEEEATHV